MEIGRDLKNVMFVGDGIDRTIVTGNKNVVDGVSQPHLFQRLPRHSFGTLIETILSRLSRLWNCLISSLETRLQFSKTVISLSGPMDHQSNMITAQGRDDQNENTGISIVNCRVAPSPDFNSIKGKFNNYLGRPWKNYSRTVFLKTNINGTVHPREKGYREILLSDVVMGSSRIRDPGSFHNGESAVAWFPCLA
ncbi:hypothetical protein Leryth_025925 [Lithospermum erythrorhizon]|nr:hypothetical protein Leryth_025925 [Lithospermum erythrorhizon]